MKKFLFLLAVIPALWSTSAAASLCPTIATTLATYIGFGPTGCTIGNATFSGFGLLTEPTAARPFTSILLTPFASGSTVGLDFTVSPNSVDEVLLENLIAYRVTGIGASVNTASASLNDSVVEFPGGNTLTENYCLGGTFAGSDGLSLCSGTSKALIAYDIGIDASLTASLTFAAVNFLSVVSDIAVDSTYGPASLTSASNRFVLGAPVTSTVPEPGAVALLGAGLIAAIAGRRRRR